MNAPVSRIAGSEAPFEPGVREVAFAPAHGTIRMLPRRRARRAPALILAFSAGLVAAFLAAAALAAR